MSNEQFIDPEDFSYVINLGPVFGPRLENLATQFGNNTDVEAFAATLLSNAIELSEINVQVEIARGFSKQIEVAEQYLHRLRRNSSSELEIKSRVIQNLDDEIPF